jgi:hypothetical protein
MQVRRNPSIGDKEWVLLKLTRKIGEGVDDRECDHGDRVGLSRQSGAAWNQCA